MNNTVRFRSIHRKYAFCHRLITVRTYPGADAQTVEDSV
ncbi:hypothetical protein ECPA35_3173, partial [Escherichia coli PA35]